MNALERYLSTNRRHTETEAMNLLQDRGGLISDCCVWGRDVAPSDAERAVEWLRALEKPETELQL